MFSTAPEEEVAAHKELERRKGEEGKERRRLRREMRRYALGAGEEEREVRGSSSSEEEGEGCSTLPCVRLIVTNSQDPKVTTATAKSAPPPSLLLQVRPGSLFLVTVQGGTIGSQGAHEVLAHLLQLQELSQVLLPDLGCSKLHARITFHPTNVQYFLRSELGQERLSSSVLNCGKCATKPPKNRAFFLAKTELFQSLSSKKQACCACCSADPSRCNSTRRQNPPIQQNRRNF